MSTHNEHRDELTTPQDVVGSLRKEVDHLSRRLSAIRERVTKLAGVPDHVTTEFALDLIAAGWRKQGAAHPDLGDLMAQTAGMVARVIDQYRDYDAPSHVVSAGIVNWLAAAGVLAGQGAADDDTTAHHVQPEHLINAARRVREFLDNHDEVTNCRSIVKQINHMGQDCLYTSDLRALISARSVQDQDDDTTRLRWNSDREYEIVREPRATVHADTIRAVIQDLLNEALFRVPDEVESLHIDPNEISREDRIAAQTLREYAERLKKHPALAEEATDV